MSFCTSCGNKLESNVQFCTGCGAKIAASAASPQPSTPTVQAAAAAPQPALEAQPAQPTVTKSSSPVVKIVLIVVLILVVLGAIGAGVMGYFAYKVKKSVVTDAAGNVTSVETPWGTVSTETDSNKVAEKLGIEVYPGAKALEGAGAGSFGNISFGGAEYETTDSLDKVAQFYKSKYPKATYSATDENNFSMLVGTPKGLITIAIERADDKTLIHLGLTSTTDGSGSDAE